MKKRIIICIFIGIISLWLLMLLTSWEQEIVYWTDIILWLNLEALRNALEYFSRITWNLKTDCIIKINEIFILRVEEMLPQPVLEWNAYFIIHPYIFAFLVINPGCVNTFYSIFILEQYLSHSCWHVMPLIYLLWICCQVKKRAFWLDASKPEKCAIIFYLLLTALGQLTII